MDDGRMTITLMIRDFGSDAPELPLYSKSTIFFSSNKTIYGDYLKNGFIRLLKLKARDLTKEENGKINNIVSTCIPPLQQTRFFVCPFHKMCMIIMVAPVLPQPKKKTLARPIMV